MSCIWLIDGAHKNYQRCVSCAVIDCAGIQEAGTRKSGVYDVMVAGQYVKVYCDLGTDGGGWTVSIPVSHGQTPALVKHPVHLDLLAMRLKMTSQLQGRACCTYTRVS